MLSITIFIALFTSGCTKNEAINSSSDSVAIISLQEKLPALENLAKSWQSDAYLRWANIRIGLDYPDEYRMLTASFSSASVEFESLVVYYAMDGSISQEVAKHQSPIPQQLPITQEDWTLDSQEALMLLLDQDALEFLRTKGDTECSFLTLERHGHDGEEHVVWSLTLTACRGDSLGHIFLDPITGEILEE